MSSRFSPCSLRWCWPGRSWWIRRRSRCAGRSRRSTGPGWSPSTRPRRTVRSPVCCGGRACINRRSGSGLPRGTRWPRAWLPQRNSHHRRRRSAVRRKTERLRAENARLTRELAKSQAVVEIMGKLQGLLETISESTDTPRATDDALTTAFAELRGAELTTKAACALIGRSRASHYRHLPGPVHGPKPRRLVPDNGQALTAAERDAVLTLINTDAYADLSIGQIWARELDEGRYLCSMSTMYRIARAAGQTRERRRQATHPAKVKPELLRRRSVPGVVVGHNETARPDQGHLLPPVRADRHLLPVQPGLDRLHRRGITPGHGLHRRRDRPQRRGPAHRARRPGHLDDVEAGVGAAHRPGRHPLPLPAAGVERQPLFRGAVPDPEVSARFPRSLSSLAHAKQFCTEFFYQYNYIHRHSGIGWHTPASVHFGTADAIDDARQQTLTAAYHTNPARFGRRPHPPTMPSQAWINQPEVQPQMN